MPCRPFRPSISRVLAGLLVVCGAGWATFAQTPTPGRETSAASVASYTLSERMPVDPEVVVGTLPNGLRYYGRANGGPARPAQLRLGVKAGSALEGEAHLRAAHFVAHMELEATRHVQRHGLVELLRSRGDGIGAG